MLPSGVPRKIVDLSGCLAENFQKLFSACLDGLGNRLKAGLFDGSDFPQGLAVCVQPKPALLCGGQMREGFFVNANSTTAPQIVDRSVQPILDRSEVYSGCYARVSVNFYAFNSNGNRGIACGLGNIQKVRDGEPLGGKSSAADDFATDLDDDFLS